MTEYFIEEKQKRTYEMNYKQGVADIIIHNTISHTLRVYTLSKSLVQVVPANIHINYEGLRDEKGNEVNNRHKTHDVLIPPFRCIQTMNTLSLIEAEQSVARFMEEKEKLTNKGMINRRWLILE